METQLEGFDGLRELAKYLNSSKTTVFRMVKNREIPYYTKGRKKYFFLKSDIDRLVEKRKMVSLNLTMKKQTEKFCKWYCGKCSMQDKCNTFCDDIIDLINTFN